VGTNPSKKVIAFDPGGTTGWTKHLLTNARTPRTFEGERVWTGGQLAKENHHRELYRLLTSERPDIVVYEAFNYQLRKNQGTEAPGVSLISREYIGVIRLYCQMAGAECIKQQPSILKLNWLENPALAKMGLLAKPAHDKRHRNDATRHMLYYLVQTLNRSDYLLPLRTN
jgi:hypothetical protein